MDNSVIEIPKSFKIGSAVSIINAGGTASNTDRYNNTPYGVDINSSGCFMLPLNNFKII